jgi:hypothetical protein
VEKATGSWMRVWRGAALGRREKAERREEREASDAREAGKGVAIGLDVAGSDGARRGERS